MTNAEKYKTAEERHKAYYTYVGNCYKKHIRAEEGFFWLELEAEEELLPCPFCGGEAIFDKQVAYITSSFRVKCSKCEIGTELHEYKQCAIDTWNRRAK